MELPTDFLARRTLLLLLAGATVAVLGGATQGPRHDMAAMSDAAMRKQLDAWYATHPAHPAQMAHIASVGDSFTVAGFTFDENGDGSATQVDTAKIFQGQSVQWKWVSGFHTVTSGTGSTDPHVGALFDVPFNSGTFSFAFSSAGLVPFFCRNHEGFNMRGFVLVKSTTSVDPVPGVAGSVGFAAPPWPNPTSGTTSFRFALNRAGTVRLRVYDAQGRVVATPLDRAFEAGTYSAAWDTRTQTGVPAAAGVYLLRLEVPGAVDTRRLSIER